MRKPIGNGGIRSTRPRALASDDRSRPRKKNAATVIPTSGVLQAVIASVTTLINSSSLDEGAPKALRMIGEALNVDRCLVFEKVNRPGVPPSSVPTYQWNKYGLEPLLPTFVAEMSKQQDVQAWLAPLNNNKPVVTTLANANATVRGILHARKATSIVLIPIFVAAKNWGHIGLDDRTPNREWTTAEIEPLLALATLFGVTIERWRQIQTLSDADVIIRRSPTILYRLSAEPGMPMTYVSLNVERLGYDQARMLAEPAFYRTLIHPDDRARVATGQAQALCREAPAAVFEIRVLAADGTYRWFEAHRTSIVGQDGTLKGFEGHLIDINERKLSEEMLRASEEQFRTIFELVGDAIIVHEIGAFAVVTANRRACELYGYTIDELRRFGLSIILSDKSQSAMDEAARFAQLAASGQPQRFEWLAMTKDGHTIWVEVALRRVTLGRHDYLLSTAHDINERKLAEIKLRDAQAALVEAQAVARLGSWEIDLLTGRFSWSGQVFQIFGVDQQTFIPTLEAVLERTHPEDRATLGKAYADAVAALSNERSRKVLSIDHRIVLVTRI